MARLIKCRKVMIDGEFHICDEICWCRVRHDVVTNVLYHHMKMDKGATYVVVGDREA